MTQQWTTFQSLPLEIFVDDKGYYKTYYYRNGLHYITYQPYETYMNLGYRYFHKDFDECVKKVVAILEQMLDTNQMKLS